MASNSNVQFNRKIKPKYLQCDNLRPKCDANKTESQFLDPIRDILSDYRVTNYNGGSSFNIVHTTRRLKPSSTKLNFLNRFESTICEKKLFLDSEYDFVRSDSQFCFVF